MQIVTADDRPWLPASHENPLSPGVWKKVLFERALLQPGRLQMINWARLPSGSSFAAHYHEDMQEVFILLQGEAEIKVGSRTAVLRRGDSIAIDAGEVHKMWNRTGEDVEYLALGITADRGGRTVTVQED